MLCRWPQRNYRYRWQADGLHPPMGRPRVALRIHVVRRVSGVDADLLYLAACFPVGPDDKVWIARYVFAEELEDFPFAEQSAEGNRVTDCMQGVSWRNAFRLSDHLRMVVIRFLAIPSLTKENQVLVRLPQSTTRVEDLQMVGGQTILRCDEDSQGA